MGSAQFNAGIPIYASAFLPHSDVLAVSGGGGEGRHGVENKVILLRSQSSSDEKSPTNSSRLEPVGEYVFPAGEDTPMTLAAGQYGLDGVELEINQKRKPFVVTGVNVARATIESGSNPHLRVLSISSNDATKSKHLLSETVKTGLFPTRDPEVYQRATAVSPLSGLVAIASSSDKATVYIVKGALDSENGAHAFGGIKEDGLSIQFDYPVQDLSFSSDGKLLAICGPKVVTLVESASGKEIASIPQRSPRSPTEAATWVRVAFVDNNHVVVAANVGKRRKATLSLFRVESSVKSTSFSVDLIKTRTVPKGAKAVTALAASSKFVVVGSPGGDVSVFGTQLQLITVFKSQHGGFPITSASVNDKGLVASTALDGSVVLNSDIKVAKIGLTGTLAWVVASSTVILLIALLASFVWRLDFADLPYLNTPGTQTPSSTVEPHASAGYVEVPLHVGHHEGHGPVIPNAAHSPHAPHLPVHSQLDAEATKYVEQLVGESEDSHYNSADVSSESNAVDKNDQHYAGVQEGKTNDHGDTKPIDHSIHDQVSTNAHEHKVNEDGHSPSLDEGHDSAAVAHDLL